MSEISAPLVAQETAGKFLAGWLETEGKKPVDGPQNRFCRFLDLLNKEFGNGFKLTAKRTDFGHIIPPAYFCRSGKLRIAIGTNCVSHHNTQALYHNRAKNPIPSIPLVQIDILMREKLGEAL